MGYYGMFMDYYYVVLVLPVVIASLFIQFRMKSTYRKYSLIQNSRRITGAMAADAVLRLNNVSGVAIEQVSGQLSDHYDPRTNVIRLSQGVYDSTSIAAVGIACHEAGHAVQHATEYGPIKLRNTLIPVCNIGSTLSLPLLILGFIVGFEPLIIAGIALFGLVALFQLVTLPVEFNASKRAVDVIESNGLLVGDEISGAKRVLRAAAMTYVAALAVSVAQLLRLILRFGNRRQ